MKGPLRFVSRNPIGLVFFAAFLLLALFILRNLIAHPQDARLAAIRKAGYPVSLSELNTYYPAVAPEHNAALVYERTFQSELLTNNIAENITSNITLKRGEKLPDDLRGELAAVLETNAAACELLYSATNLGLSRYPLDMRSGHMLLLPHLAKVKQATMLLSLEGLSHASAGESNQTFAAFNAAIHAMDSLRQEPILISYLVRIACARIVVKRLEESLNLVGLEASQLRSLQEQFAVNDNEPGPARAFAGERAFGLAFFIDRDVQRSMTRPNQSIGGLPSGLPGNAAFTAYRASGLLAKDQGFYLDALGKTIALASLPAEERIQAGPPPSLITSNRFLVFSRLLLPALQQTLGRADEHSARMRVVETTLAVERFRLAQSGRLPEQLTELAPSLIPTVPLDPYDAQPLRYKKLPHGFVVYSIGPDRHDDGGAEPPVTGKGTNRSKATPQDLTFVVERN